MANAAYNKVVKVSTAQGGTYVVVDDIDDTTLSQSGDVLETTVFSTSHPGFKRRILGLHDMTMSLSGNYSTAAGQLAIYNSWLNRTALWLQYLPTGSTVGNGFQTSFVVESYEIAGAIGDKNTVSISLSADSTGITSV